MEDVQNMDGIVGRHDSLTMKTLAQREHSTSLNDVMTRRLKNRERQRRYRARKRLEADTKKAHVFNQSTTKQAELQLNGTLNKCMTRIHCKRDWKKDARRAHIYIAQDYTPNAYVNPTVTTTIESQMLCLTSGIDGEVPTKRESHFEKSLGLTNCEMHKTKHGRRNWKADARNKKNCSF